MRKVDNKVKEKQPRNTEKYTKILAHTKTQTIEEQKKPIVIVGIGASAGGLEAIQSFISEMSVNSGMAFVVIQHLSPDYKSLMVELLSRKTEMPVLRAEDGMLVEANHVYLIPPKKNLTIFHGKLLLHTQIPHDGINLPVDIFLRSLAEDQSDKAVAVILSGTGSDGTRGVRSIKENGGLVFVQDEESAKFNGMPRAAISTGLADFILPPNEMPAQLMAFIHHPYTTRQKRNEPLLTNETGITRIFSLIRAKTKVDFTYYKPSTITRRIERRISITQADDLDSYVRYLEENPGEVTALYKELLIGVTSFFRDPEVMDELQLNVLPQLIKNTKNRELRFWVAGCSTGEEAYTLAILVRQVLEENSISRDIKIFATDIDREAILTAGNGLYPESITADLNPKLITKYFYRRGDHFQIARNIREMVVFAQHNLVKDPPFTRIDLVSCRNLLIYLQSNLQKKALEMFNFSLQPGGILLLGTSETVGEMETSFDAISHKLKIYQSKGKTHLNRPILPNISDETRRPSVRPTFARIGYRTQDFLMERLLEMLGEIYVPTSVVVNEQLEILHTIGDASTFFRMPSGRMSYDIARMVDKELSVPLATGIQKVFRTQEEIVYTNVRLHEQQSTRMIRIRICPLPGRKSDERLVIVFLEETENKPTLKTTISTEYDLDKETRQRIQDLEQELQFTRENLQATIEELETSNEELQATNEELLASNEELQSTNEELQSTNEELYTVNSEYQSKIMELTEAQNDVENLLTSSRIGTVILDEDLQIRHYSPEASSVFNILDSDEGRPIAHLSHKLLNFNPVAVAETVKKTGELYEANVQSENGNWYLLRTMPYHIGPQTFSGIVITLVDISSTKTAEDRLGLSQKRGEEIIRYMSSGLLIYRLNSDEQLILEDGNPAAEKITGLKIPNWIGKSYKEIWPGTEGQKLHEKFLNVLKRGDPCCLDDVTYSDDRIAGIYHIHAFKLPENRLGVSFEDITLHKQTEQKVLESENRYHKLYKLMADAEKTAHMGSWTWDVATDTVNWSDGLFQLFHRSPLEGAPSYAEHDQFYTKDSMRKLQKAVEAALKNATPYELKLKAIRSNGSIINCIARGQAEKDKNGKIIRLYGSLQEIL